MKCRYCDAQTRVVSTRTRGEFYVVRRQQCEAFPDKHRFNTVEVLETLIKKFPRTRIEELLGHNRRGAERNRLATERREKALAMIREGEKYDVIAATVGVSLASVRKYAREGLQAGELDVRRGGHGTAVRVQPARAAVLDVHNARDALLAR